MKKTILLFCLSAAYHIAFSQTCSVRILQNDTTICAGQYVTLSAVGTGTAPLQYYWSPQLGLPQTAGQTVVANPPYTTNYIVSLYTGNGCQVNDTIRINVLNCPLRARFTTAPDSVCSGAAITFTDHSTGNPTAYLWDFGDGSVSTTGGRQIHTYSQAGNYLARLIVGLGSHFDTTFQWIHMLDCRIIANFNISSNPSCQFTPVQFNNTSTGNVGTYKWLFGDGGVSFEQNPTHTYTMAGNYNVDLTITRGNVMDSIRKNITIVQMPTAHFHFSTIDSCNLTSKTYQFVNSSLNAQLFKWNFGDGTSSVAANPTHIYTRDGIYTVQLSAANPLATCATDSLTRMVQVQISKAIVPTAGFTSLVATSECTLPDGWTNYFNDNNTPLNLNDDILLLSLKKNGNNIGQVGDGTFRLKTVATQGAGSNTGILLTNPLITNPSGFWVMNRYWEVNPTQQPITPINVRFYFNTQDLNDVNGSFPAHNLNYTDLLFYKTMGGNPDPTSNLNGATRIISLQHGAQPDTNKWVYSPFSNNRHIAEFKISHFSGGGGGATGNRGVLSFTQEEKGGFGIQVSPNPAQYFIQLEGLKRFTEPVDLILYNHLGQIVFVKRAIGTEERVNLPILKHGYYQLVLKHNHYQIYHQSLMIAP